MGNAIEAGEKVSREAARKEWRTREAEVVARRRA